MRTGPQTLRLQLLIQDLLAGSAPVWKRVAADLSKATRQRRSVNLYKINSVAREGEIIVVPGKVLSVGNLDKKVTVAAYKFSSEAKAKIAANGTVMSIEDLLKTNPEGKGVRIVG